MPPRRAVHAAYPREAAVEQALAWRAEGRSVLVHCAYGHGLSVAVVIGVLVREGHAADSSEGMRIVAGCAPRRG